MNTFSFKSQTFKHFSWGFFAVLMVSSPLFLTDKEFLNLWLNQHHTVVLDFAFKYLTYLGDGWLLLPLGLLLLSRNYFLSLIFGISLLLESFVVQVVLKHGFFSEVVRPMKYIANSALLHRVEGVEIHSLYSFPSGHTQTAFLIFTFLALFCKRKISVYILLFVAVLVGLSRVYLLQHFFVDIWFGSLIGYTFPVLISMLFYRFSSLSQSPKWTKGFLKN